MNPASLEREPPMDLAGRAWSELDAVQGPDGHQLVREQILERDATTGEVCAIPIRLRIPRQLDLVHGRVEARKWFAAQRGLDTDRDSDIFGAAALGFWAGKEIADRVVAPEINEGFKSIDELNAYSHKAQMVAESPGATQKEKQQALAELQARIKATEQGGNVATTTMGWLAHAATGASVRIRTQAFGGIGSALSAVLLRRFRLPSQHRLQTAGKLDKPTGGNGLPPKPGNGPGHGG